MNHSCIGEGNGNLPQDSCLENPTDRGAWWATVHGVARVGNDFATKPPELRNLLLTFGLYGEGVWALDEGREESSLY